MKIRHLYISAGHNYFGHSGRPPGESPAVELEMIECVAGKGIMGDRFFDHKPDYRGQITFFEWEIHQSLCKEFSLSNVPPSNYRRNVITENVDLNSLIGKEFTIQGVTFFGTEECKPCYWMDQAIAKGAESFMKGHGGLRARILTDGSVKVDER
jgi:MOSC domain-containing protein YiiM